VVFGRTASVGQYPARAVALLFEAGLAKVVEELGDVEFEWLCDHGYGRDLGKDKGGYV